ncbi:MAG: acyl-CoA thioesterase, partial [Bacteroidales bacterium]|nr:acyl-CoA thioesterase [Bacteroidales bacterium]
QRSLSNKTLIRVRFSEVDSMGVVWHGNYIKYFEDGREEFGNKYGINYLDFRNRGILIPIVKIVCDYKKPLIYGDTALVETKFIDCEAAKIQYDYTLFKYKTHEIVATGSSLQVFLNLNRELLLDFPPFFIDWKKQNGLWREHQTVQNTTMFKNPKG